jgi:hypothetical protein
MEEEEEEEKKRRRWWDGRRETGERAVGWDLVVRVLMASEKSEADEARRDEETRMVFLGAGVPSVMLFQEQQ